MNYKQIKAIEQKNKQRILKLCATVPETSGIYFLTREENGFKYAYIGQAKHLLTRLAQHLSGYQYIDLSIKKHGLYSVENRTGWQLEWLPCSIEKLDEFEQHFIKQYAAEGYQLRNKTSGSQGEGKQGISANKQSKGYYDGLEQGKKVMAKEIKHIIDKHLDIKLKKETKISVKALEKFWNLLDIDK
jgi:hypothetical protein